MFNTSHFLNDSKHIKLHLLLLICEKSLLMSLCIKMNNSCSSLFWSLEYFYLITSNDFIAKRQMIKTILKLICKIMQNDERGLRTEVGIQKVSCLIVPSCVRRFRAEQSRGPKKGRENCWVISKGGNEIVFQAPPLTVPTR